METQSVLFKSFFKMSLVSFEHCISEGLSSEDRADLQKSNAMFSIILQPLCLLISIVSLQFLLAIATFLTGGDCERQRDQRDEYLFRAGLCCRHAYLC